MLGSTPTPPDSEWRFDRRLSLPDYQLYAWMEYEYGRSSCWLRQQVSAVRERKMVKRPEGESPKPSPGCRFACLLAKHAQEFPDRAWSTLDKQRRDELLARLELDRWDSLGRERILRELDLDLIAWQCARGEPFMDLFRSSLDRYVAFRINLGWSQPQIKTAFAAWLRRACEDSPNQSAPNVGRLAERTKGRGLNRRLVLAWMNRLVALRWGKVFSENWEVCWFRIQEKKVKGVGYSSESNWTRAQFDAANLLRRFEFAWKKDWTGAAHEILQPRLFTHKPGCQPLRCHLPWSETPWPRTAAGELPGGELEKAKASLCDFIHSGVHPAATTSDVGQA